MNSDELAGVLESVLFGVGEGISLHELCKGLEKSASEIRYALEILRQDYTASGRGIRLVQSKDTYQLSTKPEYYELIQKITHHKQKNGLSKAALESLAIIAYRQPTTRVAIDDLRGVSSSSAIQGLLDRGLICEAGRLEAPGRPILYKTSLGFLKTVGLKNLKDLPEFDVFLEGKQESFDLEVLELTSAH